MSKISIIFALSLSLVLSHDFSNFVEFNEKICDSLSQFDNHLRQQLNNISSDAKKIIDFVVNGTDKGVTYRELTQFVDQFGPRLTGTENLEKSIDYMVSLLNKEGHDKVYTEDVTVPKWVKMSKLHFPDH